MSSANREVVRRERPTPSKVEPRLQWRLLVDQQSLI